MSLTIRQFFDPACPWCFSAEGARLRIAWRYGDAITWERHAVVLSEDSQEYVRRGIALAYLVESRMRIRDMFGMPVDTSPPARHQATIVACRAVVAARLFAPEREEALLRRLRVLGLSHGLRTDEPATLARAADESDIDSDDLERWMATDAVEETLRADMALARSPSPPAMAMVERLAQTPGGVWRYTCPSWEMTSPRGRIDAPGFQPARVYEVALANLAPDAALRPTPDDVAEVVAWAPYPLATVEVAAICEIPVAEARRRLGAVATETPVANDSYWMTPDAASTSTNTPSAIR
jgi:predicted DsbA family dithiol-disulfide isomerase